MADKPIPFKPKSMTIDDKAVEEYIKYENPKMRKQRTDLHYDIHVDAMYDTRTFLEKFEKTKKEQDEKFSFKKLKDEDALDIVSHYLFKYLDTLHHNEDLTKNYSAHFDKLNAKQKSALLKKLAHLHLGDREDGETRSIVDLLTVAVKSGETREGIVKLFDQMAKKHFGDDEMLYKSEVGQKYYAAFGEKDAGVISAYLPTSKHFKDAFAPYQIDKENAHVFKHLFDLSPQEGQQFLSHLIGQKHKLVGPLAEEQAKKYGLLLRDVEYTANEDTPKKK